MTIQHEPSNEQVFFSISINKMLLLSVLTLGTYNLYWFYKNWQLIAKEERHRPWWRRTNPSPFMGAVLSIFYYYPLLKRMRSKAAELHIEDNLHIVLLAGLYLSLGIISRLPGPESCLTMLSFLLLLPAQKMANKINSHIQPNLIPDSQLTKHDAKIIFWCWVLIICIISLSIYTG